jgi:hypothetical protein
MKTRSTIILVATAVALSFAFTAIVTPKAVKAAIATLIRDQDNAARRPFTTKCVTEVSTNSGVSCDTPAIPAGEEVVIESISFAGAADPINTVLATVVSTTESGALNLFVPNNILDSGMLQPSAASFRAGQVVRLYADPGTTINCAGLTQRTNPSTTLFFGCSISGYSVSLP